MKKALLIILSFLLTAGSFAQDPLATKFLYYQKAKPTTNLFVHFDKNVYSSNETVWFTGYVINSRDFNKHRLMSVALIKESDNAVILEDRFVMQGGFSFGNIIIPDSIPAGNYRFSVITDYTVNNLPEVSFSQPITIKSMLEPPFKASMKVISTDTKAFKVMVSTTTADNRFLEKPTEVIYTYGNETKSTKTDASGQAVLILNKLENLVDGNLYVKLLQEKDSAFLNLPIVQPKGTPEVKFYPEGGHIIGGVINNIGWEVKDRQKKSIAVKAYLYKDNKVVDTVDANNLGLGTFKLLADPNAKYTFKINSASLKDTTFMIPVVKNTGIALHIANAVVTDTLRIELRTKKTQTVNLRIHNYRTNYLYTQLVVQAGLTPLRIPLTQLSKGLATLTFTDSLDRPIVERLFFAHYENSEKVNITADKGTYGPREKVNLKLQLKNIDEKAVVSVAVVQDVRLEPGKTTDIESYSYLNNELSTMPINTKGSTFKDKKYLEQLLLIKGWRRYNWQDLNKITAADTNKTYKNLLFMGSVTKSKKPLTAPILVGAMGSEKIRMVTTAPDGTFDFNTPELYTVAGKKLFMFLNKNTSPAFKFNVSNQLFETNKKVAELPSVEEKPPLVQIADNSDLFVKSNEKTIRLREVTIAGKKKSGGSGSNACGDYVCVFNILNCRNHFGDPKNMQPVTGRSYKLSVNSPATVYGGCNVTDESIFFRTEGVHTHKEFYIDSFKDPLEPAYFSTIFWNYSLVLDKDKETSINFYTSDIVGKYRVVVQGITQKQVIYSQSFFDVKRK